MLVYTLKQILPRRVWEWLKRVRQRLLGRRAYMNPSYSIEGEDRIVRALLWQKHDKGFYVDVGAHHPFRFSNTYLFYTQGWSGINIDATPGSMKAFNKYRPRDINLEVGIGGRKTGGVIFRDSACGLESWISAPCGVDRPLVLSSLQALKSPDSSSAILESKSSNEKPKSNREQVCLESKSLDSSSLSSRAAQSGAAIHSLESSFAKVDSRARAVDSMDCHADKSARNDRSSATSQKHSNYMEYYMFNEPAWNTFDKQVAQNSLGKLQRIVKVPLLTLGEVLHTYVPKGVEIDFLSIDCEGFDLSVLRSNDWESFVPHIIIVEILTNIYGELDMVALQDNEIARFLFSKGYALVAKAHNSVIFQHKDKR